MRILITGAGGFIGSYVVDYCRRQDHFVIGIDRKLNDDWIRGNLGSNLEICEDVAFIDQQYHLDFDLCYHLAAESRIQPSFHEPLEHVYTNMLGTAKVLEVTRKTGGRLIYAGSSTADDSVSKNVYATTKVAGEMLCQAWSKCFGLSTAVARFYNVYGPRQVETGKYSTVIGIWENQLREGLKLTVTGDGSQRRDFTHVNDIVSGLVAIGEKGREDGHVYGLGTGINHSIIELAKRFVEGDAKRIQFVPRPPGESEVTLAEIEATSTELGWQPTHNIEEYIDSVGEAGI